MKQNIFSKLNSKLEKLSKTTLILILVVYALILGGVYALVTVTRSYLVTPEYEHVYFDEHVNPQITIIGRRTYDDEDKMTLKYSVNVSIYGRINASSTVDPGYSLTDFKMSAATVSSLTSKSPSNMYYFTEYKTYTTPTTHYFTIDNSSVNQHPITLYTMIQYKKGSNTAISTYREDVFLYPEASDIAKIDEYFSLASSENATSRNIVNKNSEQIANVQFIASDQTSSYSSGVKITMQNLGYNYKHHIDMQSWILTEDGKYLPFIGVYSYSQQKSNYTQSGISIDKRLNPKYIVSKVRYYFSDGEYSDFYFKQSFDKLPSSFQSAPSAADNEENPQPNNNKALTIALLVGLIVVVLGLSTTFAIIIIRKKNNSVVTEENIEDKNDEAKQE
ncbi:MAG: hypothetical protein J6W64_06530 [Bacilli bacterium]|nr:hypothetical protein [Bacilli bacterium]